MALSSSTNKPYECDLDRFGFGTMQPKQSTPGLMRTWKMQIQYLTRH